METQEKTQIKPEISFEDFMKADIRLCLITSAEKVEKSDKLLKLTINTGVDERVVVSGIAHQFRPGSLIGMKLPFILNLAPRKIKGIESNGMIIMSQDNSGDYFAIGNNNAEIGSVIV